MSVCSALEGFKTGLAEKQARIRREFMSNRLTFYGREFIHLPVPPAGSGGSMIKSTRMSEVFALKTRLEKATLLAGEQPVRVAL